MRLKAWEELPDQLKTESVRPYYDALRKKQGALFCKRLTDLLLSAALLVVLSPVLLVLAICIKLDTYSTCREISHSDQDIKSGTKPLPL